MAPGDPGRNLFYGNILRSWSVVLLCLIPLIASGLTVNEIPYIELRQVAGKLGMKSSWLEKGKSLRLKSDWTQMDFEIHKREMSLNGLRLFMGNPVVEHKGRLHISEADYGFLIEPILTPQVLSQSPALRHIMIDPGHGGDDPGAQNVALGLHEKSLALDMSKRLEQALLKEGFKVSLTRRSDVFIPLQERGAMANRAGADLFLSIHFNATGNPEVRGIETYAMTPFMQPSTSRNSLQDSDRKSYRGQEMGGWNTLLAYYVQRSLIKGIKAPDRGLKRAQFTVLQDLAMPGILIEGGFVTHSDEGRNIGSATYREKLVAAIVDGVLAYQRTQNRLLNSAP